MSDTPPTVATGDLAPLAEALKIVDEHAVLNDRYRWMLRDARHTLTLSEIRLTQARGIAKKLVVLVRAASPGLRSGLGPGENEAVDRGVVQANELIYET